MTYAAVGLPVGLGINSTTGAISGTVDYAAAEDFGGVYTPTVIVTDSHGGSSSQTFTWNITDTPRAPVLTNPGNQTSAQGDAVGLQIQATDPDGNALVYSATGLPSGVNIDDSTGLISGTIDTSAASAAPYSVTVTAADPNLSASQTFLWTVTATNRAPQLVSPGNQVNAAGDSVSVQLSASDSDGDTLSYAATNLPAGVGIDPSSGLISGTIANSAASPTPYSVTVTASDGMTSSSQTISWTVNYVGVTNPSAQANTAGDVVSLPITAYDATGGTLSYTATGLPSGVTINGSTGEISGTIAAGADGSSPYTTTVTASDGTYSGNTTFTWTVAHLSLANPGDQVTPEGTAVALQMVGTDIDGDHLTYAASGLPAGVSVNTTTGLISGTLAAGAAVAGPSTVTVCVSDGTHTATQTFVWTPTPLVVLLSPGPQGNAAGDSVSLALAATSGNTQAITFSAANLPPGLSINSNTGLIYGTIAATAGSPTPYTATVTATAGGYSSSVSFPWAVSAVFVTPPGDQSNTVGDQINLALAGTDHDGDPLTWSATGLPPGVGIDPNTGVVSGTLAPGADSGSPYTVTVVASDGTTSSSQTFTWSVAHFAFAAPANQSGYEGQAVSLQLTAHDADGDPLTWSATGLPAGVTLNANTGDVTGTLAVGAATSSPYSVTVTASDGSNSVAQTFNWTVTPHVQVTTVLGQNNAVGDNVSLAMTGSDATYQALAWSASGLPSGVTINSTTGQITGTISSGADSSSPYTVTVTASDGTYSGSQTFSWVVSHVFLANPGNQANTAGDTVSVGLSARDNDHDTLSCGASGLPPGVTVNSTLGYLSGTISTGADANSPYTVTVTASDGTHTSNQSFTWSVAHLELTQPSNQSNAAGTSVMLGVSSHDVDGDTVTYSAAGLPPGVSINGTTGMISGTLSPDANLGSPYVATVTASDGSNSVSQSFTWTVTPLVSLTSPGTQMGREEQAASVQLFASDANQSPITYSATGLPPGVSVNSSNGQISGTPTAGSVGTYTVVATASASGASASQTFTWTVGPHVSISAPPAQSNVVGDTTSLNVSAFDQDQDTLSYSASGLPPGVSISSSTGQFSGTIGGGGLYHATVSASDGTYTDSASFTWLVAEVQVTNPGAQQNTVGDVVSLALSGRDGDHNALTWSAANLPAGLAINRTTGVISGTLTAASNGIVTVTAADGGNSASQSFAWAVAGPVTLANPGSQSNAVGDSVYLALTGSDGDGHPLSWSSTALPPGLSLAAGVITGTISAGADSNSPYSVTVTAADGVHQVSQVFSWTVAHLSLANPGNQSNTEGDVVSLQLAGFDADNDALSYSATGLPAGLSVNTSSGLVSGTLAAGTAGGPYNVTVTVSDGSHQTSQTFLWSVAPRITLGNPGTQSNADGDTVSLALSAQDKGNGTLSYSATGLPPGLGVNSSTGVVSGTISSSADSGSPYSVTVTATDGIYSNSQSFTWNVAHLALANPGTQTSGAGTAVSLQLAGRDTDHDTLSYTAAGLPPGVSLNTSTGQLTGTLSSTADANSPYSVTVMVSDGTHNASQTFNWIITPQLVLTPPGDQSNADGDVVSLALGATDAPGRSLTWSATNLPPGVSINTSTGVVSGTISTGDDGNSPYAVTVTANDGQVNQSQSFTWTVAAHVTLTALPDQSNADGDAVSLAVMATDDTGAALTYSASNLPPGVTINSSTGQITGTISASADTNSPYAVTVTASDGTYSGSVSFNWAVSHLSLTNPGAQSSAEGQAVALALSGHDSDNDTLTWSATGLPAGVSINSGTGAITGTLAAGSASNMPYTVVVTLSDGTHSVSQAFTWTVSYIALANPGDQENPDGAAVLINLVATDPGAAALTYSATGLPAGVSINSSSGVLAGTLGSTDDTNSPYTVVVSASDGTHSASQTFTWTVDTAPTITISDQGDQTNVDGDMVSVPITATDPFGGLVTFSAVGLPPGASINPITGVIGGAISNSADTNSPYTVTVTASDGTNSGTDTFNWTVAPLSLTNPGNQSNAAGTAVSLALQASTPTGDPLTFTATGLPQGLGINSVSGVIAGTLAAGVTGDSLVTVTATDGTKSVSQTFTWSVTAEGLAAVADQTNTEGDTVSLQLSGTGSNLTYTAANLPPGVSVNGTMGQISGTIAAGDAANGPYTVDVSVSDGTHVSGQGFTWTVNPVVSLTAPADQTNVEGSSVALQVQASEPGKVLTYSAVGLPPGVGINASTGMVSGVIATGAAAGGPYGVMVTATDGTNSTSQTFNWNVTPASVPPAPVLNNPGSQSSLAVAEVSLQLSATDPGGYPLTWSATGLPDGLGIDPFLGEITGTVADDAISSTPYLVTVTADNGLGGTASQTFTWSIAPSPMTGTGALLSATEGNDTGTVTVAAFSTPDMTSQASDFRATVNWGDGSSDTGSVVGGNGVFGIIDDHVYAEKGTYGVSVVLVNSNGGTATAYGTATVADAALTLTGGYDLGALHQQAATLTLATFTDGNPSAPTGDVTATVSWGDGTGTLPATVGSSANGLLNVSGTHSYAQDGTYTTTVTVTDADGATATTTSTVTVGEVYAGVPSNLALGTFTDANPGATSADFTATWTWGDGTNGPGTVTEANGVFTVAASHNYAVDGTYSVSVSIQDDGGNTLNGGVSVLAVRPAIALTPNSLVVTAGQAFSNVDLASFTEPGTSDTASEFSAEIDWQDGTPLDTNATVTGAGGLFQVLGSHTYAVAGLYTPSVTVLQHWEAPAPAVKGNGLIRVLSGLFGPGSSLALQGPTVMPGNSMALYQVTNLGPGERIASWIATGTLRDAISSWSFFGDQTVAQVQFKNMPAWGNIIVRFTDPRLPPVEAFVAVVQVSVTSPRLPINLYGGNIHSNAAFVPGLPASDLRRSGLNMQGVNSAAEKSQYRIATSPDVPIDLPGSAGLFWFARASLLGPTVNFDGSILPDYGVRDITVGFIQHERFDAWRGDYLGGGSLSATVPQNGRKVPLANPVMWYLDVITNLGRRPMPFEYNAAPFAQGFPWTLLSARLAGQPTTKLIWGFDTPGNTLPLNSEQRIPKALEVGTFHYLRATRIQSTFQLDVAATSEDTGLFPQFFWKVQLVFRRFQADQAARFAQFFRACAISRSSASFAELGSIVALSIARRNTCIIWRNDHSLSHSPIRARNSAASADS